MTENYFSVLKFDSIGTRVKNGDFICLGWSGLNENQGTMIKWLSKIVVPIRLKFGRNVCLLDTLLP